MEQNQLFDWYMDRIRGTEIDEEVIRILYERGFFEAPASKGHHLAEKGGLALHSAGVTSRLMHLTDTLGLTWQRESSPVIVGMMHDLCKMDSYIWVEEELRYKWNEEQALKGHGDKSVMIASQLLALTEEEVMCIRYHMGAFSDDPDERKAYSNAVKKYPNVLWTHTADMWSSQVDGR